MATLAELQQRLDDLRAMRAAGIRSAEYNGRRVEYRSDGEMQAAIDDLQQQVYAASNGRVHTIRISASKFGDCSP